MKKIQAILLLSLGLSAIGYAQDGHINISEDQRIPKLIEIYQNSSENSELYKIQVYFGSYQKAQGIKSQVDIDFPEWGSKIDFQEPSYRVRVGAFKTKMEAERKLIEIRKKYPSAMLLKPEKATP